MSPFLLGCLSFICFCYGLLADRLNDPPVPVDFDCPMRQLSLEYAMKINPHLSKNQLQGIADALNGGKGSINKTCVQVPDSFDGREDREAPIWDDLQKIDKDNTATAFVDFNKGNDNNNGSIKYPLKHLDFAVKFLRKKYGANVYKRIILRQGKHYIGKTINITPLDNNLLITNYNGEFADISGAKVLNCSWNNATGLFKNVSNVYSCQINDKTIDDIDGLRVNGSRGIRARYPNGNPEVYPCGFCSSLTAPNWIPPTCTNAPDKEYNPQEPLRNTSSGPAFAHYQLGVGGCCNGFTPNAGYWCGNHTEGGGAFTYLIPSGINFTGVLPNSPYKTLDRAVIQTWRPSHWSSWMFLLDGKSYDSSKSTVNFLKGGFQGARGETEGAEFFIENVYEELDYPTEFFYDTETNVLYYVNNITDINSPLNLEFEITNLKVVINYTGTMSNPVKNQALRGVTIRDTKLTYLDPHGMPSGGDWGLERTGAVYLDGVNNITISNSLFTRLDGNAISINRYARDVVILQNEFVWQGDSVITQWGDTENITFINDTTHTITSMGWDGTNGNQPRGTIIRQNLVHEIGISEKQSSMYFQAKSCQNIIDSNIFYNGPRAAINFNDGFGGGSIVKNNILMNTCRESGDHGPFNSWDRQVYVTKVRNGTASVVKEWDYIYNNFIIANPGQEAIDNDDGSCYYKTYNNFFVYGGGGLKTDFSGHDNHHYNNIYGYTSTYRSCFNDGATQIQGHNDAFYNNTCVLNTESTINYGVFNCNNETNKNVWPILGNNTVILVSNNVSYTGLCNIPEQEFQKKYPGKDDGTVIKGPVDNAQLIQQARQLLGM